jgi:hypothetical protein
MKKTIRQTLKVSDYSFMGELMLQCNAVMYSASKLLRRNAIKIDVQFVSSELKAKYKAISEKDGTINRVTLSFDPFGEAK